MEVSLSGVTQRFGAVTALDDVGFRAGRGAIHALVGENGAGKTTLMRVLFGALQPNAGTIELDGKPVHFRNSADAINAGIGMVSQHYSVIPELTCLQNLMLGAEPGWLLSESKAKSRATELAGRMGYSFNWGDSAEGLSPAGKQKLEILKLLWRDAKVMILDEPTAMLSPADSEALYSSLASLAAGGATVIVVTHRLPEVMDHCQTVHVLRGGRNVANSLVAETGSRELAEMIVGHDIDERAVEQSTVGDVLAGVNGVTLKGYRGDDAVEDATFVLRAGEIVGLAGVDGNGQRELFQALLGRQRLSRGSIMFSGEDWTETGPRERIERGLRLIPEDRHLEGVIDEWSLEENAALGLQRLPPFARGLWVDSAGRRDAASRIADRFKTKHGGLRQKMSSLSGGNQQRYVAARALEVAPKLLLAFQPTRGLDIDGTAQVYGAIRQACQQGACALVVSFDLDELLEHCDRVLTIFHGRVQEPPAGLERDRQAIGRMMVGTG